MKYRIREQISSIIGLEYVVEYKYPYIPFWFRYDSSLNFETAKKSLIKLKQTQIKRKKLNIYIQKKNYSL
jgi:hypothetical protein